MGDGFGKLEGRLDALRDAVVELSARVDALKPRRGRPGRPARFSNSARLRTQLHRLVDLKGYVSQRDRRLLAAALGMGASQMTGVFKESLARRRGPRGAGGLVWAPPRTPPADLEARAAADADAAPKPLRKRIEWELARAPRLDGLDAGDRLALLDGADYFPACRPDGAKAARAALEAAVGRWARRA